MVHRRAARYVCCDCSREASVTSILNYLYWRSRQQIRVDVRLVLLCKVIHDIRALAIRFQLNALCETLSPQSPSSYLDTRSY